MGTGDSSPAGQRAEHQRFLPELKDKQERIFLLAEKAAGVSMHRACEKGRTKEHYIIKLYAMPIQ